MDKIPVRNELTVLPADPPGSRLLGWRIYENLGCPLRDLDGNLLDGSVPLQEGQVILAWDTRQVVERSDDGWIARSTPESKVFTVLMSEMCYISDGWDGAGDCPRKHCWIAMGQVNMRGLSKLSIGPEDILGRVEKC